MKSEKGLKHRAKVAFALLAMHIEKRSYSSNPWRLVDSDGREVYRPQLFRHPEMGDTEISSPVCGSTRKACEAAALELLEKLITVTG